jgi:hypothetical protein
MLRGRCFSVVIAESMFYNHEETPVYPLYIDPIHDFGYEAADTTLYHCNRRVVTAPHTHPTHSHRLLVGWLVCAPRFYRYDPSKLRFVQPPHINLRPDKVCALLLTTRCVLFVFVLLYANALMLLGLLLS